MLNNDSRVQSSYAGDTADGFTYSLHRCKRFVKLRVCIKRTAHGVPHLSYSVWCVVGIYFLTHVVYVTYILLGKHKRT